MKAPFSPSYMTEQEAALVRDVLLSYNLMGYFEPQMNIK